MTFQGDFQCIDNYVYKISKSNGRLSAYLVNTISGLIQVGCIPEFFKTYFGYLPIIPDMICIPSLEITELGDSITGIEFVLWSHLFGIGQSNSKKKHIGENQKKIKVIGHPQVIDALQKRVSLSMVGDFENDENNIPSNYVPKQWSPLAIECITAQQNRILNIDNVSFKFYDKNQFAIYEKNLKQPIFDTKNKPIFYSFEETSKIFSDSSAINYHLNSNNDLNVTVVGNGVGAQAGVTSSFFIDHKDARILIDAPAYYKKKLSNVGIAHENITHFIISHIHEDHIEGFSGLLYYYASKAKKLPLVTTKGIYESLQVMFNPFFDRSIKDLIHFYDIESVQNQQIFGSLSFETRRNYHTVETIGFKFSTPNKTIGISGDTMYHPDTIEALFERKKISKVEHKKLLPSWFQDANILLHDVTTYSDNLHTLLPNLEILAQKIPNTDVYGYHYFLGFSSPFVKSTHIGLTL